MKKLSTGLFLLCGLAIGLAQAEISLGNGTTVVFATVDEAKEILTSRDDFVRRLSPFDRAARMKTDQDVSEKEYLEFVGRNVLDWSDVEKQNLTSAVQGIRSKWEGRALPFPKKVFLVKTTGDEEGGAAYTRANAIILPKAEIAVSAAKLREKICHELFHILSRANPELREKLYAAIGFVKCEEAEFPTELKPRKITNPDAPANDHCILVKVEGKDSWAIPILFSNTGKYDPARGGEFFDYLQFRFLLVGEPGKASEAKVAADGVKPGLVGLQQVSGFLEQVGRNTEYLIHPEEILADNFTLLILQGRDAPSPEIIGKMKEILDGRTTAGANAPVDPREPRR